MHDYHLFSPFFFILPHVFLYAYKFPRAHSLNRDIHNVYFSKKKNTTDVFIHASTVEYKTVVVPVGLTDQFDSHPVSTAGESIKSLPTARVGRAGWGGARGVNLISCV